jgi:peptidase M23-like protein
MDVDQLIRKFFGPFQLSQGFGVPNAGTPTHERHTGIDIAEPRGTAVRPTARGRVTRIFRDPIGGIQEDVQLAGGYDEIFAHLDETSARVGQDVTPNDVIGRSGATGAVTGAHLHFEVHDPQGRVVDPVPFLQSQAGASECPAGYHMSLFGCVKDGPVPDLSPIDKQIRNVSDPKTIAENNEARRAAVDELFSGFGGAIVKLAIGVTVLGAIALVGVSGVKRTID